MIKILLVDDHQIVLDGLQSLLGGLPQFEVIGTANNGRDALQAIPILKPAVVLMDIEMPIMNGIIAAQKAIEQFPEVKIIILSLHFEKPILQKMLEMQVSGYLLKNADQKELIQAIEAVAAGKQYFSSEVTTALLRKTGRIVPNPQLDATPAHQLALLSERETEVLKLLAEGFSSKEISEQIFLSVRTVETHRFNLMKKLDIKKLAHLIRFAVKCGLVED